MKRIFLLLATLTLCSGSSRAALQVATKNDVKSAVAGFSYGLDYAANGNKVLLLSSGGGIGNITNRSGILDLFVADLTSTNINLISRGATADGLQNAGALNAQFTPDGTAVIYETSLNTSDSLDTNHVSDIYLKNLNTGTLTLISANTNGNAGSNLSENFAVSSNGNRIAFESRATDLHPADRRDRRDIFVRDIAANVTYLASILTNGTTATGHHFGPAISPDGESVAFVGNDSRFTASQLSSAGVFVRNLQLETTVEASALASNFLSGPLSFLPPVFDPTGAAVLFVTANSSNCVLLKYVIGSGETIALVTNRFPAPASLSNPCFTTNDLPLFETDSGIFLYDGELQAIRLNDETNKFVSPKTSGNRQTLVYVQEQKWQSFLHRRNPAGETTETIPIINLIDFIVGIDGSVLITTTDPLIAADKNQQADVYLWPDGTNNLLAISLVKESLASATSFGNHRIGKQALNNPAFVFSSDAYDLDGIDPNHFEDIFMYSNNVVRRVYTTEGTGLPPFRSEAAFLSGNGNILFFRSSDVPSTNHSLGFRSSPMALDLTTGIRSTNGASSSTPDGSRRAYLANENFGGFLQVYDAAAGTNIYSSPSLFERDYFPTISKDGRFVFFISARRLTSEFFSGGPYLYSMDLEQSNKVALLSFLDNRPVRAEVHPVSVRSDNELVIYKASDGRALLVNTTDRSHTLLASAVDTFGFSPDGSQLVYARTNGLYRGVFTRSIFTTNEVRISPESANGASYSPVFLGNRFVVYVSQANNIVDGDTNGFPDIFLFDILSQQTRCLSTRRDGRPGNGPSVGLIGSQDGHSIAFHTHASDLIPLDFNQGADLVLLSLTEEDADLDTLPDDWEALHFGTLVQDGSDDADSDGLTDGEEFRAGTHPMDSTSTQKVVAADFNGSGVTLRVATVPGKTYQLEKTVSLGESWQPVGPAFLATEAEKTLNDTADSNGAFYRIRLVE